MNPPTSASANRIPDSRAVKTRNTHTSHSAGDKSSRKPHAGSARDRRPADQRCRGTAAY